MLGGARAAAPAVVIRNALLSGVIALGYAFGSMRRSIALSGAHAGGAGRVGRRAARPACGAELPLPPETRAAAASSSTPSPMLVAMVGSYTCFLWFMNGTAARYLRVRAEIELAHQIHQVLVPRGRDDRRRIRVLRASRRRAAKSAATSSTSSPHRHDASPRGRGELVRLRRRRLGPRRVVGRRHGDVQERAAHAPAARAGRSSSLLEDLNTVLFPLKSGAMYVTAACVRGGGRRHAGVSPSPGTCPSCASARLGGAVEEITTPQIPIGMFEDYRFTSAALDCDRGDLLALITDGLTEVFDAQGRGVRHGRGQARCSPRSARSPARGDRRRASSPPPARTARRSTIRRCS